MHIVITIHHIASAKLKKLLFASTPSGRVIPISFQYGLSNIRISIPSSTIVRNNKAREKLIGVFFVMHFIPNLAFTFNPYFSIL